MKLYVLTLGMMAFSFTKLPLHCHKSKYKNYINEN